MSGTHNKLQGGNNFTHWKFWDLGFHLKIFFFFSP